MCRLLLQTEKKDGISPWWPPTQKDQHFHGWTRRDFTATPRYCGSKGWSVVPHQTAELLILFLHSVQVIAAEIHMCCVSVYHQYTLCIMCILLCHLIQALADCIKDLLSPFHRDSIDVVAGIDAMGFILGKRTNTFTATKRINGGAIALG